jgi:preprotein translocase subunit SecD
MRASYRRGTAVLGASFLLFSTCAIAAEPVLKLSFSKEQLDLNQDDLDKVYVAFDSNTSEPIVVLRMSEDKAKLFELLTGRHIGEAMDVIVCSKTVLSPHIMDAIRGRMMQISGGLDVQAAEALANQLQTGTCPAP